MSGRRGKRDETSDSDMTAIMTITSTYTITTSTSGKSLTTKETSTLTKVSSNSKDSDLSDATDSETTLYITSTSTVSTKTHSASKTSLSKVVSTAGARGLDGVVSTNESGNSVKKGLAIGIPVSIAALFILIVVAFIYFKKKSFSKRKSKLVSYKDEFFKYVPNEKKNNAGVSRFNSLTTRSNTLTSSTTNYVAQEKAFPEPKRQLAPNNAIKRQSLRVFFKDRLSRVIYPKDDDYNDNEFHNGIKSPVFLRKFNLGRNRSSTIAKPQNIYKSDRNVAEPSMTEVTEPQFLSLRYNESTQSMSKNKTKNKTLPGLPNLINAVTLSLDRSIYSNKEPHGNSRELPRDNVYLVVKSYHKLLNDEVDITVGDKVLMLESHSDNWCKVRLLRDSNEYFSNIAQEEGVVPKMCLKKML
ncbi:uncharacterized protein PRCAT00006109001 [Priceomyces carsonii]|uniref:uncharacterized protein n=1 Tax=Priceomyces carsonii TaxID=28549 RepID=UPI002ED9E146|nr:unnamed protein product [Priceomyces carsonii]